MFQGGGAQKLALLHEELKNEIGGAGILSVYGMTECPIISLWRIGDTDDKLAHTEGRFNTCGTEFSLRGPKSGEPVPAGEEGEPWLRAAQLGKGYVDERLNRMSFDEKGFFRTGDLVRIDEEGYLAITGRVKDIIIRKGENIAPKEIEDFLNVHPKVADVAVIGLVTDVDGRGELACAVIVPAAEEEITLDEVCDWLDQKKVSKYKWPEQLEYTEALPYNAMEKMLKRDLQMDYAAQPPECF